jgi:hypothetical protein
MALELQIAILIVAGIVGSLLIGLGTYLSLKHPDEPTGFFSMAGGVGLIVFAILVVIGKIP